MLSKSDEVGCFRNEVMTSLVNVSEHGPTRSFQSNIRRSWGTIRWMTGCNQCAVRSVSFHRGSQKAPKGVIMTDRVPNFRVYLLDDKKGHHKKGHRELSPESHIHRRLEAHPESLFGGRGNHFVLVESLLNRSGSPDLSFLDLKTRRLVGVEVKPKSVQREITGQMRRSRHRHEGWDAEKILELIERTRAERPKLFNGKTVTERRVKNAAQEAVKHKSRLFVVGTGMTIEVMEKVRQRQVGIILYSVVRVPGGGAIGISFQLPPK